MEAFHVLRDAAGPSFNDIKRLIICTTIRRGLEKTCFARFQGNLKRSDQSPKLHLSGEEISNPNLQTVQAIHVHHTCPPRIVYR